MNAHLLKCRNVYKYDQNHFHTEMQSNKSLMDHQFNAGSIHKNTQHSCDLAGTCMKSRINYNENSSNFNYIVFGKFLN
jgi:hypothetical protein